MGVTSSADVNRDNVKLKSPDTGGESSAGCGLSLPTILLESPETKILSVTAQTSRVTPSQSSGQEKLLGPLNVKEASDSSLNQKAMGTEQDKGIRNENKMKEDGNESVKSRSELILQNAGKYSPSPQLMTLVNLSRNISISGCLPSTHGPGMIDETTASKLSEVKVNEKPRVTPQSITCQGSSRVDSKRLSLSTPRRQRHVRVLDFTTPPKSRTVPRDLQPKEPSSATAEKVTKTLQRSVRSGVTKARSTLFKSPHNESETTVSDTSLSAVTLSISSACSDNYYSIIPPIATRSPLPRLSGGWDSAAGVGQIICDENGSDLFVSDTQYESTVTDKQSEVTKRSTDLLKNRETGCKMTQKHAEESSVGMKSLPSSREEWDSKLRSCISADCEETHLPSNDCNYTANKTTKKKKTKTKLTKKALQVTEEEVRSLEEHLNKDEHTDSESINKNRGSTNGALENIPSNLIISLNTSTKNSEKTGCDSGDKNQNRDLNNVSAVLIKEKTDLSKKNVEPKSESDCAHLDVVEKLSVKLSSKYKNCVPVRKVNKKKDGHQPTDMSDNRGTSNKDEVAREPDEKQRVTKVQRKEILALETACNNKADLPKSSDSSTLETVSSSTSVGLLLAMDQSLQVIPSPADSKAAEGRIFDYNLHIHQSLNSTDIETVVSHAEDVDNNTSLVVATSQIGCELACIADGQHMPVSQSEELVSSASGFYPSGSQNKDFHASDHHKPTCNREPSFADVPLFKMSGAQKQVCDTVIISNPQAKVVTASILDTPRKIDDSSSSCWGTAFMSIPLTPRMRSPQPDDTPVTKQVNGNSCLAFSLIETPSFPPTPNIAVTPQSCHTSQSTPYAARSTDYLSGSAYYKPSDKLDSSTSTKPLEQLLIEECTKLENTITAQTSYAYNESREKDIDHGQQQPLPVADKTLGETPSGTDREVKVHVGKDLVSGKVDNGKEDFLVCLPNQAQSSKKQKQAKGMTKKSGVRSSRNSDRSKATKNRRKKAAGSLPMKGSGTDDNPSAIYFSPRRKTRALSGTADKSSDFECQSLMEKTSASTNRESVYISRTANTCSDLDKPQTHTSPSFSAKKKARASHKNHQEQVDFLVDAPSSEKQQWAKETTQKSGIRGRGNGALSKDAKRKRKNKTGSPCKVSGMEDKPLEVHTSARRKARPVSGTANESDDLASVSRNRKVSVADKRKARPISGASKKRSNLEAELSETQMYVCKGLDRESKDEIIRRCLDVANLELFGYSSPSDDSDFESSNDFGQSELESKTVKLNDGNDEKFIEMRTTEGLDTERKKQETVGESSKLCSTNLGDGNSDVQQVVEPQRQDELSCVSELSLGKEKSPGVPSLTHQAQIREIHTDKAVSCESFSCHSEMSGLEIFTVHNQPVDDSRKSPVSFTSDLLGEQKHCSDAELEDTDISASVPNNEGKEPEERGGGATFTSESVPSRLELPECVQSNYMCDDQDVDARKQLREKEGSLAKTALFAATKLVTGIGGETTQAKKNSHLSVEAIADRLTREKIAVQANSLTQPAVSQHVTDDSSFEDSPALRPTESDSQSECISLLQVESQLATLHGVEGVTSDSLAVGSTPRSAHDVCRDLEQTPDRFQSVQSNVKLLPTVDMFEHESQELVCKEQSRTGKKTHGRATATKKLSVTERQENTNKKIKALLGDDVSPLKTVTEAREVCKDTEHGIFHKLLPARGKQSSPIKDIPGAKPKDKLIERSGVNTAVKEIVQENKVLSMQSKVCESDKMKTTNKSEFCDTAAVEVTDGVDSRMEGLPSQGTSVVYERYEVSSNETYIEIVYADEGPKEHTLVFEDISNFSLIFELGEHSDEGVATYKCTISEFQELFCASPKQCTSRPESCEDGQSDIKGGNSSVKCTNNSCLGYVTNSKDRHKVLSHKGRSAGSFPEEHKTSSRSPCHKRSADFSHDRVRTSHSHKGSPPPVCGRRTSSANPGRKLQSFSHRSPSSSLSPVSVKSKVSKFSPLNELYNQYTKHERDSVRSVSHYYKRDQYFNFGSNERLTFGHRGRGRARYYDRHISSQRVPFHFSSRESWCTSSSSSSSSGYNDRKSAQEVKAVEISSTKISSDRVSLTGMSTGVKDLEQQPGTVDAQMKGVKHGRQKVLDNGESAEEGELLDEDSLEEFDDEKCDAWLRKDPSSGNHGKYSVQVS
jgi:hypothetical protein